MDSMAEDLDNVNKPNPGLLSVCLDSSPTYQIESTHNLEALVKPDTMQELMDTDSHDGRLVIDEDLPQQGIAAGMGHDAKNLPDDNLDLETMKVDEPLVELTNKIVSTNVVKENATDPIQCYCLKERNPNILELQCGVCYRWFHESCISYQIGKCVPFITNYTFLCKNCSPTGLESFSKRQSNFTQMCQTALANLMQQSVREGNFKTMFSKDKEVIPFIDSNWENLTTVSRRIKQTWHNTVYRTMVKEADIFVCEEKPPNGMPSDEYPMCGLAVPDVLRIGPNYESYIKGGQFKSSDSQKVGNAGVLGQAVVGGIFSGKGRGAKRKAPEMSVTSTKKARNELAAPKLPPHGYPLEHPFNKDGYRYILAEPDPHAPFRQEFDESLDWAGKPIPGWLYRTLMPPSVLLALHDRAPQLKISDDRLSVTGEKGYCMVRATHGINYGTWYFECTIEDMPENSATRLGWSQALGNLQAPLGYDRFSYSWRSRKGTRFHESRGKHYSEGYGEGDTLGFLLCLPEHKAMSTIQLPQTFKDKPLVKFKSHLYYEEHDEVQKAIRHLKPLPESRIIFYKNGKCQGVAWEDIYEGTYYPALSLYKNATVSMNFGPNFKYPPVDAKFRGMHEAAHEAIIEQAFSDMLYLVENDGKLRLDTFLV